MQKLTGFIIDYNLELQQIQITDLVSVRCLNWYQVLNFPRCLEDGGKQQWRGTG